MIAVPKVARVTYFHWGRLNEFLLSAYELVREQMLLKCDSCSKATLKGSFLASGNTLNDDWRGLG